MHEQLNKVYLVFGATGDYDRGLRRMFSTKEKAETFVGEGNNHFYIDEIILDEDDGRQVCGYYYAHITVSDYMGYAKAGEISAYPYKTYDIIKPFDGIKISKPGDPGHIASHLITVKTMESHERAVEAAKEAYREYSKSKS